MEISNLSDAKFKTLVIRLLKEFSEDLKSLKKILSELKDTLIEIKNNLQGNNNRVDAANDQINDLEHKEAKKQEEKESKKNVDSVSSLWHNLKHSNIHIIRVLEGDEKEQKIGNLFEKIMKENFPNLVKEIDMQVQEEQRVSTRWTQTVPHLSLIHI